MTASEVAKLFEDPDFQPARKRQSLSGGRPRLRPLAETREGSVESEAVGIGSSDQEETSERTQHYLIEKVVQQWKSRGTFPLLIGHLVQTESGSC